MYYFSRGGWPGWRGWPGRAGALPEGRRQGEGGTVIFPRSVLEFNFRRQGQGVRPTGCHRGMDRRSATAGWGGAGMPLMVPADIEARHGDVTVASSPHRPSPAHNSPPGLA